MTPRMFLVAFLALAGLAASAHAERISYTLAGRMSGTVFGLPFSDKPATFIMIGDTDNPTTLDVGSPPKTLPALEAVGMGIEFGHQSVAPLVVSYIAADPALGQISFVEQDGIKGVTFTAPELAGYDLMSLIGPVHVSVVDSTPFDTSIGPMTIDGGTLRFQALVPEPATLMLAAGAFVVLTAVRRRRKVRRLFRSI